MQALTEILRPYQREFFLDPRRFKIANWSRQSGKDFTIAGMLCYTALAEGADGLSICITTNLRTASELLRKSIRWAKAVEAVSKGAIKFQANATQITFSTGARVICLPAGDGTAARGWTVNGALLVSEAAFIPHLDEFLQGIGPTLTTNPRSQLIFASTPSGKNHQFYHIWCSALEDPQWMASKVTIEEAIQQGMNVDIEQLHKLVPDPEAFAQEYMCEFASEYSSFIDISLLDFTDIPQLRARWLGVDVGRSHDKTALCTVGEAADGQLYVEDIEMLSNAEYTYQQSKIVSLNAAKKYTAGYIDANGIGASLAEFVQKSPGCARISGFVTTGSNKPLMYEHLRAKILEKKLHFAKHLKTKIETEFSKISRIVGDNGKIRFEAERDTAGHSDSVSALVLAVQAAKQNPLQLARPVPHMPYSLLGPRLPRL